ncbi:hypothetical protein ACIBFB_07115 [Nocardiopsis sp. NPDC050513]|uniref:hypothetical protein n=1 Tax=Nocardiopsis sp. NPDC050513 TaxID=3364338 RepID=UPI0037A4C62B
MFDILLETEFDSPIYNADRRGTGALNLQIDQGILQLQDVFNPLVLFLATLGILLAAIRLLWTRRLDPMMDMIRGLLTVIVVTFGGIFLIYVLRNFSTSLSSMILQTGTFGDQGTFLESAQQVYPSIMRVGVGDNDLGFGDNEVARGALSSMVGLAVILGLIAQMVVLALLNAIVYLLACLLPLAAASAMIPGLKIFSKVIGWLFACFLYKPLLLIMYLAGLVILASANEDDHLLKYLLGAGIMLLATGALPVLMKLMSSGSVWMMAFAAGGLNSITSGGGGGGSGSSGSSGGDNGGSGGSANADPANAMNSANSGTGGAQAAAAGANERAAGVARNLDEGGPGAGGDGSVMAASASDTGSGAAATAALGTQNGQLSALGGTGDGGPGAAEGAMNGGADGGADMAASGAAESVSSTVSGSDSSYSQTVASGADDAGGGAPASGGDAPGGAVSGSDAPGGASMVSDGGGSASGGGGSAPSTGAGSGSLADGADGRMV